MGVNQASMTKQEEAEAKAKREAALRIILRLTSAIERAAGELPVFLRHQAD